MGRRTSVNTERFWGVPFQNSPLIMLIKTHDKWIAAKAVINTWLKDKQIYCGNCDSDYDKNFFPCCSEPILGTNYDHTKAIVEAIKDQKKMALNEYASNRKRTFRSTVKLPKRLYHILNRYYKNHGTKLFENQWEMRQFARKFKMFKVPVKI